MRTLLVIGVVSIILTLTSCTMLQTNPRTQHPTTNSVGDIPLETSGITKRVPLPQDATLGQGYSLISDNLRGFAVESDDKSSGDSPENLITYTLELVDGYEELKHALGIDAKASLKAMGGKYSASFSLYESTKMVDERAYVVVKMTVLVKTLTLTNFRFINLVQKKFLDSQYRPEDFRTTYGDSFVYRLARGAEIDAVLEVSKKSDESAKQMKAALSAKMGSFSGNVSVSDSIEKIATDRNIRIRYTQTGASTGRPVDPVQTSSDPAAKGGVLVMSVKEFLGRIRDFPEEARQEKNISNAAILWGDVIDYATVENRPRWAAETKYHDIESFLVHLGKLKTHIDALLNKTRVAGNAALDTTDVGFEAKAKEMIPFLDYVADEIDQRARKMVITPSALDDTKRGVLPSIALFHDPFRLAGGSLEKKEGDKSEVSADAKEKYGENIKPHCSINEPNFEKTAQCLLGSNYVKPFPDLVIEPEKEPKPDLSKMLELLDIDLSRLFIADKDMPEAAASGLAKSFKERYYRGDSGTNDHAGHWVNKICGDKKKVPLGAPYKIYDESGLGDFGYNFYAFACVGLKQ